jgi:hypothetical protein
VLQKPLYTTVDSVKVRLAGKVQFQQDPKNIADGELPDALLLQLIADAETQVEQDLRGRYAIPFTSKCSGSYDALPDHSKRALRIVVDLRAVIDVLDTDFGRGTHIDGDKYSDPNKAKYKALIGTLLGQDQEGKNGKIDRFRRTPPLEDVKLAKGNTEADDGYRGTIINTDASRHGAESYAEHQINDPSIGFTGLPGRSVVR